MVSRYVHDRRFRDRVRHQYRTHGSTYLLQHHLPRLPLPLHSQGEIGAMMDGSPFLFVLMIAWLALAVIFFLWRWSAYPDPDRRRDDFRPLDYMKKWRR